MKVKVKYTCPCGQSYILRGTYHGKNLIDTGFKQCVCGNNKLDTFELEILELKHTRRAVGE